MISLQYRWFKKCKVRTVLIIIVTYNLNTIEKHMATQNRSKVTPPLAPPQSPALHLGNLLRSLKHVSTDRRHIVQS